MILLDANILIYAYIQESSHHHQAKNWLDEQLNNAPRIGIPWASSLAFLRITTNPRIFKKPVPTQQAMAQILDWLGLDHVWIPEPGSRHAAILGKLIQTHQIGANLIPDAHLVAICIEHGLRLCSYDTDFSRFPEINWVNPALN